MNILKPLPKPKALLFDWDNTLADTWPIIHKALNLTQQYMEADLWSLEETKAKVAKSMRDSFPALFGERWEEAGKIYQSSYRNLRFDSLSPMPNAQKMLEYFRNQNLYMAIVSNKIGNNLREEVTHLGYDIYFDKIIGSTDAKEDKPSIYPLILALDGTSLSPCECWFIGDSIIDLECAYHANSPAIFYGEKEVMWEKTPPHAHIKCHSQLINLYMEQIS